MSKANSTVLCLMNRGIPQAVSHTFIRQEFESRRDWTDQNEIDFLIQDLVEAMAEIELRQEVYRKHFLLRFVFRAEGTHASSGLITLSNDPTQAISIGGCEEELRVFDLVSLRENPIHGIARVQSAKFAIESYVISSLQINLFFCFQCKFCSS